MAYSFFFPSIAIVGNASPGGWPLETPGEIDSQVLSTTDGVTYTLASITLTNADGTKGVKFRANNSWTKNWGSAAWPSGTGIQGGDNIPPITGTYGITFNQITGAYVFGSPLATQQFNSGKFNVYPNPTQNSWNISANDKIESVQVVDISGKLIMSVSPQMNEANIDASGFMSGIYFAKVKTATATNTLKLIKN